MPSPKLNFRAPQDIADQLERHAARTDRNQSAVVIAALREYFSTHTARDAEDLVWSLVNTYASSPTVKPTATFEVTPELAVTVSVDPPDRPLTELVEVSVRRESTEIVLELRGLAGDINFAGVTVPVGSLRACAGTISVRLEDLAPSAVA